MLLLLLLSPGPALGTFLEDGQEYVYLMETFQNSGTMDHQPAAAALASSLRIHMQVAGDTVHVRTVLPRYSRYLGPWEPQTWAWDRTNFVTGDQSLGDFSIHYKAGLVERLTVPSGASLHQRNAMRALASAWQISTQAGTFFQSDEKLLHGSCRVQYTVGPGLVTKAVSHLKDCANRVFRHVDNFRGYRCDGQWAEEAWGAGPARHEGMTSPEPIYSSSNTMFFVEKRGDRYQVHKMVSAGAVVAQYFETEGVSHFIHVNRSLTLLETKASDGRLTGPTGPEEVRDLTYQWEAAHTWDDSRDLRAREPYFSSGEYFGESQYELKAALVHVLDQMVSGFDLHGHDEATITKLHKFGAGAALPVLYALNTDSLMEVFTQLKADASESGVAKQNMFREFVIETGTTASAMWIKEAITKNLFDSERDSARAVTGVAFHVRRPNQQLLQEYEGLMETYRDGWSAMVGPLALAHLARRTCDLAGSPVSQERHRCTADVLVPMAERLHAELMSTDSDHRKHLLVRAMGNLMAQKVSELLAPMARGEVDGVDDNLRKKALYSSFVGTFYTQSTVKFYLPIFLNMQNGHESRITALDLIFYLDDLDVTTLSTVMTQMYLETDYEVLNFMFTLFEKHAHGQNSCFSAKKTERIGYFLKYMKQAGVHKTNYGLGVSKTYRQSFHQEEYGYGGGYEYWVLGSHRSSSPLELGMQIDTNLYNGYKVNLLAVVVRIEGLAKGLVSKFHKLGKEWRIEQLQAIFSNMGVHTQPDTPVRVEITIFLKNIVVAQSVFTATDAEEGGKLRAILRDLQGRSANTYSLNHQRAFSMGSSLYEQPTDSGLPMAHVSGLTSLASLKATVKRGLRRGVIFRDLNYDIHMMTQGSNFMLFQEPSSRFTYGIVQDRVFTAHLPRQIVLGINLVKKELRIQISEPEIASPLLAVMHSKTAVTIREASLTGDTDLTANCPACTSNTFVISRGPSALRSRTLMDTSRSKLGSSLKAEYFDCEMDLEAGKAVGSTVAAFLPYNKTPKTPWSIFMLGLRQARAFFLYFPRAEQCGLYASYSQSEENPVREIDISIQGTRKDNRRSRRFGQTGKTYFLKLKVVAKGPENAMEDREFKVNVKYDSSVMARKNSMKIQFAALPNAKVELEPYMVCISMENEYSNANPFETELMIMDLDSTLEVNGKADIKYGVGSTCSSIEGSTDVKFRHSTTPEAREQLRGKDYAKKCFAQKVTPEWATRTGAPYTHECWQTEVDAGLARKYTWTLDFEKTTPQAHVWLEKAHTLMKASLLPYWDANPEALTGALPDSPKVDFDFTFRNEDRTIDAVITTEKGTSSYPDVAFGSMPSWTSLLRQLRMDETISRLIWERVVSACVQTSSSVATLDWATTPANSSDCWSLLSGHCAPSPTYAVFTRRDRHMQLAMKMYLGGHLVEFTPTSSSTIRVTHNGREVEVEDQGAARGTAGKSEVFTLTKWGSVFTLYSNWNVFVLYDGTFVEVIPAPWVKGQHCGVCGDFDGNSKNDMVDKLGGAVPPAMLAKAWCQ